MPIGFHLDDIECAIFGLTDEICDKPIGGFHGDDDEPEDDSCIGGLHGEFREKDRGVE